MIKLLTMKFWIKISESVLDSKGSLKWSSQLSNDIVKRIFIYLFIIILFSAFILIVQLRITSDHCIYKSKAPFFSLSLGAPTLGLGLWGLALKLMEYNSYSFGVGTIFITNCFDESWFSIDWAYQNFWDQQNTLYILINSLGWCVYRGREYIRRNSVCKNKLFFPLSIFTTYCAFNSRN